VSPDISIDLVGGDEVCGCVGASECGCEAVLRYGEEACGRCMCVAGGLAW
jgi:hypothetical protein